MTDSESESSERSTLRRNALSRWENEGGALRGHRDAASVSDLGPTDVPPLSNAELVQHHVRVIALENVVISLLAAASDKQLALVREMAVYISPRPDFTPHPLTLQAAAEMISLVERAGHFKDLPPS